MVKINNKHFHTKTHLFLTNFQSIKIFW